MPRVRPIQARGQRVVRWGTRQWSKSTGRDVMCAPVRLRGRAQSRTGGRGEMADTTTNGQPKTEEGLDRELQQLLERETFEPPDEFRSKALFNDESVYEEADRDHLAWWEKQASELHWFEKWDKVLDDSDPPFYKWFAGGKTNLAYNCLDRHVENGLGARVAFHWRGEEGEERDITYAD